MAPVISLALLCNSGTSVSVYQNIWETLHQIPVNLICDIMWCVTVSVCHIANSWPDHFLLSWTPSAGVRTGVDLVILMSRGPPGDQSRGKSYIMRAWDSDILTPLRAGPSVRKVSQSVKCSIRLASQSWKLFRNIINLIFKYSGNFDKKTSRPGNVIYSDL